MIDRKTFMEGLNEIHEALHRNFESSEEEFLFGKLERFDEDIFKRVLSWYIREDHPPRNLLGYFLKRCENDQTKKPKPIDMVDASANLSHTSTQSKLLSECYMLAISLWQADRLQDGDAYISDLFTKWNTIPDQNLSKYLEDQFEWLKKKEIEAVV